MLRQAYTAFACAMVFAWTETAALGNEKESHAHEDEEIEEIIVSAHPLADDGTAHDATVIDTDEINRSIQSSIGAVVKKEVGIHSASYGEAVGRPIIHGLGGTRVRVMEDQTETMDASVLGVDHAVATEAIIAERIDILKGPSTLLYGSGAIGGVVDVHTHRIPSRIPNQLNGKGELRGADNGGRTSSAIVVEGGGDKFAWHIDLFGRNSDEYEIPVPAESSRFVELEEEHEEEGDMHHEDEHEGEGEHEDQGTLTGSQFDTLGGAVGLSFVDNWGFVGGAISKFDSNYGLPGHSAHGHEDEDDEEHEDEEHHEEDEDSGSSVLDMSQTRVDIGGLYSKLWDESLTLKYRLSTNDYEHFEIEEDGIVGTHVAIQAMEGRVQISTNERRLKKNVYGMQFSRRDFSATGDETFVPPSSSGAMGIFWLGERSRDRLDIELGLRVERSSYDPIHESERSFNTIATSLGLLTPLGERDRWELGMRTDYSTRAPVAEELYSNGPHLAASRVERGDPDLEAERAMSIATSIRHHSSNSGVKVTAYYSQFSDFIVAYATGEVEDELPVVRYVQHDAVLHGLDFEASRDLIDFGEGVVSVKVQFDTVSASVDGLDNNALPQLPPTRLGGGFNVEWNDFDFSLDLLHVQSQSDTAIFELPTDSYNDVSLYAGFEIPRERGTLQVFLIGSNLTDAEQRSHTSFIKDIAPMPGRSLELGVRMTL